MTPTHDPDPRPRPRRELLADLGRDTLTLIGDHPGAVLAALLLPGGRARLLEVIELEETALRARALGLDLEANAEHLAELEILYYGNRRRALEALIDLHARGVDLEAAGSAAAIQAGRYLTGELEPLEFYGVIAPPSRWTCRLRRRVRRLLSGRWRRA